VVTLTSKAPSKIPGQAAYPSTSKAAREMPVGGHTAVALGWTNARDKPSLPATKYTPARRRILSGSARDQKGRAEKKPCKVGLVGDFRVVPPGVCSPIDPLPPVLAAFTEPGWVFGPSSRADTPA